MFMSVIGHERGVGVHADLAGARVLITGLDPATGVELARGFADHKARLVIQAEGSSPELTAIAGVVAESASELKLHTERLVDGDAAVRFAQGPAQVFGGLDAVVNLVSVTRADMHGRTSLAEIEDLIADKLLKAVLITRIVANRMRLTLQTGLVLNVVRMPEPETAAEAAVAGMFRSALAAMTRGEAQQWADQAIRINAVGPRTSLEPALGACLSSEPDIAALALHLASRKGRNLSGHVFDATGVARGCRG